MQLGGQFRERLFNFADPFEKGIVAFSLRRTKRAERLKNGADLDVKKIDRVMQLLLNRRDQLFALQSHLPMILREDFSAPAKGDQGARDKSGRGDNPGHVRNRRAAHRRDNGDDSSSRRDSRRDSQPRCRLAKHPFELGFHTASRDSLNESKLDRLEQLASLSGEIRNRLAQLHARVAFELALHRVLQLRPKAAQIGLEQLECILDLRPLEKTTGKVAYAVMSFGGFLGLGEEYHTVPWSAL